MSVFIVILSIFIYKQRGWDNFSGKKFMKKICFLAAALIFAKLAVAAEPIEGYWTTVDDETNTQKSVVRVYEYDGKYYARVIELFDNKDAVAAIDGSPKIVGLDVAWGLQKDGNKFKGGKILDPKKGKVYGCEMWVEDGNLVVRGKIAFLGRNQIWLPNKNYDSAEKITPQIPVK